MKSETIIPAVLVTIIQIVLFVFTWDLLVGVASGFGHSQRGGVGFGITIYYGVIILGFGFFIASLVSASSQRPLIRWWTIAGILLVWSLWMVPSLSNYPIRASAHLALGGLILIVGSGILIPFLFRICEKREHTESEPCVPANPPKADG